MVEKGGWDGGDGERGKVCGECEGEWNVLGEFEKEDREGGGKNKGDVCGGRKREEDGRVWRGGEWDGGSGMGSGE